MCNIQVPQDGSDFFTIKVLKYLYYVLERMGFSNEILEGSQPQMDTGTVGIM